LLREPESVRDRGSFSTAKKVVSASDFGNAIKILLRGDDWQIKILFRRLRK
jgi:hypothetical protein